MKNKLRLTAKDKEEIKKFLIENITLGNREFSLIIDSFLDHSTCYEVWLTYSKDLLNMELESLKARNISLSKAIPTTRFRMYIREVESNTWKSLITGIGGYKIDTKKYSLVKVDLFGLKGKKN
ncbi:hypothetical protein A6V39_01925 [Candidatus Mycoplasma haematobovis]|uniref:Uncharacterized protein n=1 Tax=Candidatus Mycoplasma haematobovis TaxID=432608 RepID=A0A1A9QD80_9MOLU|nr:hypothetical protein [Candidatus Mycoplasma haematobovis]OAL10188.1 hypothetical protein A6V39_01925 [Candidatus Mycoplasma haematobovis]